jgi:hypothetical protein
VVAFPDLHPADRSSSVRAARIAAASDPHSSEYPAVMNPRSRAARCLVRWPDLPAQEKSADEMLLVGLEDPPFLPLGQHFIPMTIDRV